MLDWPEAEAAATAKLTNIANLNNIVALPVTKPNESSYPISFDTCKIQPNKAAGGPTKNDVRQISKNSASQ
jgi:hypothetical protein